MQLSFVKDEDDAWANNLKSQLCVYGNERTRWRTGSSQLGKLKCSRIYNVRELPQQRYIQKYSSGSELPIIHAEKVGIFIGAHQPIWREKLTRLIDRFCEIPQWSCFFCDQTSNYRGKYRVLGEFDNLSGSKREGDPLHLFRC